MASIIDQINKIRGSLKNIQSKYQEKINQLKVDFKTVSVTLNKYEVGWAGEWLNDNFDHYFVDFEPNNDSIYKLDIPYFRKLIQNETGIISDELKLQLKPIVDEYCILKEEIVTELSFIKDLEKFQKESLLFDKIEKFHFGLSQDKWIETKRPKAFMLNTYQLSFFNKGYIRVPPHIAVEGEIYSSITELISLEEFALLS